MVLWKEKYRTLQEMSRTLLDESKLPKYFWAEAINTSCYIQNRILIRPFEKKTCFEMLYGKKPNISYFKVFGCKCFVLKTLEKLGKFDSKSDDAIFLGYSSTSKAYRVYNKRTLVVEESIHVTFDEIDNLSEKLEKIKIDNEDEASGLELAKSSSNIDQASTSTSLENVKTFMTPM